MSSATLKLSPRSENRTMAQICGLGTALPRFSISREDACEFAQKIGLSDKYSKALTVLYRQSGVEKRYSVLLETDEGPVVDRQSFYPRLDSEAIRSDALSVIPSTARRMEVYRQSAPGLATQACRKAILNAQVPVNKITHLITVSCTGFCAPGVDIALIDSLGLPAEVQRTNIGFMGCHGSLNGLRVARSICESQPEACVLMVSVELCSLHHQYTNDAQQLVAGSLFSDGSAAVIVQSSVRSSSEESAESGRENPPHSLRRISIVSNGSVVLKNTQTLMNWQVGDFGFEMGLSPQVPEIIQRELPIWTSEWLDRQELSLEDIAGWIIHPGGPRILSSTAAALNISDSGMANSRHVLRDFGNMSSATVLFILEQSYSQGLTGPVVMLGFGPGLCIEACLLNF